MIQRSEAVIGHVLVVDDHEAARRSMADILGCAGHEVACVASAAEALAELDRSDFDVVITDLQMPGMNGLEFIRALEQRRHGAQVVMMTAHATVGSAVEAMRHGAFDYIEKPFQAGPLEQLIERALKHGQVMDQGHQLHTPPDASTIVEMVGESEPMRVLRQRIAQAAPTPETVLITGESGTGKELVARAIHAASDRADSPMVSLNCPVLSAHLMESELFGHNRGAFTGADRDRTGRFELADGGTILLDELSEIELPLQAKLLRVLQEKSFERVGSGRTIQVDVRILATSNRNLLEEVEAGRFREDLYYRLAVLPLHVPPLRQRREDIETLIDHFLAKSAARLERSPCEVEAAAIDLLVNYHWPGNVRELENIVTRASVLNLGEAIRADELRPWLISGEGVSESANDAVPVGLSLQEMERKLIEATLDHYDGHRAKTAKALGIGLRTLSGKLKSYGYAPRTRQFSKAA